MEKFNTFEELVALAPQDIQDRLTELRGLVERPDYHPEPNCYEHVRIVTSRLMKTGDIDLVLAGLYHDIGKRETVKTNPRSGFPMTPGHEHIAAKLVERDKEFIREMGGNVKNVQEIAKYHMKMKQMSRMRPSKQQAVKDLKNYDKLCVFTKADSMLKTFNYDSNTGKVTQTEKDIKRNSEGYAIDTEKIDWIT